MIVSRRCVLAAGVGALGLRIDTIRFALASGAAPALAEGVGFGLLEASRAMTLLGHRLELAPSAALTIAADASIEAGGTSFHLRPDDDVIDATIARAREAGASSSSASVVVWHHSLARYGASELNERFTKETGRRMTPLNWLGWIAVKIIAEASLRGGPDDAAGAMARARFDGHKGEALSFARDTRRLRQPLYVIDASRDTVLWPT